MGGTIFYLVKKFGKQVADGLDDYSQVAILFLNCALAGIEITHFLFLYNHHCIRNSIPLWTVEYIGEEELFIVWRS